MTAAAPTANRRAHRRRFSPATDHLPRQTKIATRRTWPSHALAVSSPGVDEITVEIRSLQPAVSLPLALVWRRERDLSPAARAFIELVRRETATDA